jgi:hypothetical protein
VRCLKVVKIHKPRISNSLLSIKLKVEQIKLSADRHPNVIFVIFGR